MRNRLYFLILSLLFLASCQTEEYEVITEQDPDGIIANTEVYDLVYRAAMNDGSADDEIDNSPCFSLDFPYTLSYNGNEQLINSQNELREFLDNLPADTPEIVPNFPFTVVGFNYQRIEIRNRQQYAGLQQACRNNLRDRRGPITCAGFVFPVQITLYDSVLQQTSAAVINSRRELFDYMDNLSPGSIMKFVFPLEMRANGNRETVNNRSQLMNLLQDCD